MANRMEPPKPGGEPPKPEAAAAPAKAVEAAAGSGGIKGYIPLILALAAMPVMAYVTTTFVLLPKMEQAMGSGGAGEAKAKAAKPAGGHGESAAKGKGESKAKEKKVSVPLKKVLVNVAGTQATRYLLANLSLVGAGEEFNKVMAEQQDKLVDVASAILAGKTLTDLEKPGARNLMRTELISAFNNCLGENLVEEIYFTEFAVQ
jgi:flagellar FliL protein